LYLKISSCTSYTTISFCAVHGIIETAAVDLAASKTISWEPLAKGEA
jgi:hypothetical protein